jgi:CheY-like chemotaxis protein
VREFVESAGQVEVAEDGRQCFDAWIAAREEALRIVDEVMPDIALIDLSLKNISGVELLTQLKVKPNPANCLFICHTGRGDDEVDWRGTVFDDFLQKPVDAADFDRVLGIPPFRPTDKATIHCSSKAGFGRSTALQQLLQFAPGSGVDDIVGLEPTAASLVDAVTDVVQTGR